MGFESDRVQVSKYEISYFTNLMINKSNHKKIKIGELTSGNEVYIDVLTVGSKNPGLTVYIQSAIHGPEIQGIPVLWELFEYLKNNLTCGKVIIVPCANPYAVDMKISGVQVGRVDLNSDEGSNWNRCYFDLTDKYLDKFITKAQGLKQEEIINSYGKFLFNVIGTLYKKYSESLSLSKAQKLAFTLQKLALGADIVIDVHSSKQCSEHVYFFEHEKDGAKSFGVKYGVVIPDGFEGCFDEAFVYPWIELKNVGLVDEVVKEAYTLELAKDSFSSLEYVEKYLKLFQYFLSSKGMCKVDSHQEAKTFECCKMSEKKKIFSSNGGIFHSYVEVGDSVNQNDVLGEVLTLGNKNLVLSPFTGVILSQAVNHAVETGQFLFCILNKLSNK